MKQLEQQLLKSRNTRVLPFPASPVPCPPQSPATSPRPRSSPEAAQDGGGRAKPRGSAESGRGVLDRAGAQAAARRERPGKTPRGVLAPGRVRISRPQGRAGSQSAAPRASPGRGGSRSAAPRPGQGRAGSGPQQRPAAGAGHCRPRPPWPWERQAGQSRSVGTGSRPDLRLFLRYRARPRRQRPARGPAPLQPRYGQGRALGRAEAGSWAGRGVRPPPPQGPPAQGPPAPGPRGPRRARHEVGAARAAGKR